MADTSDLKSDEVIPHEGSSPSSGITQIDEFRGLTRLITDEELEFLRKTKSKIWKK